MSIAQREAFIGFCAEVGAYAACWRGTCIGHYPSYLSAEAAINRAAVEQAAEDEADGARMDAEYWLDIAA